MSYIKSVDIMYLPHMTQSRVLDQAFDGLRPA